MSFDPLDDIAPAPRTRSSGNLFDDLAADMGIEEELGRNKGKPRPETPVYPPESHQD